MCTRGRDADRENDAVAWTTTISSKVCADSKSRHKEDIWVSGPNKNTPSRGDASDLRIPSSWDQSQLLRTWNNRLLIKRKIQTEISQIYLADAKIIESRNN